MMPSGYLFLPCHFSKRLPYIAESISAAMVSLLRSCESTPHCGDSNLTATTTAAELGLPPCKESVTVNAALALSQELLPSP